MRNRAVSQSRLAAAVALAVVALATLAPRLMAQKPRAGVPPAGRVFDKGEPIPFPVDAKQDSGIAKPAAPDPIDAPGDVDPEAKAREFVDRSQKEADAMIASLTKESESLRARLAKVEAGLSRWQAIKNGLPADPTSPTPAADSRTPPATPTPSTLLPPDPTPPPPSIPAPFVPPGAPKAERR